MTILSGRFCARVRQQLSPANIVTSGELLTMEQVRRAADVFLAAIDVPPQQRRHKHEAELTRQHHYQYQRRNAAASRFHRKSRLQELRRLGIDPNQIKSVLPNQPHAKIHNTNLALSN